MTQYTDQAPLTGSQGDDVLTGSSLGDRITGQGGDDTIDGLQGSDVIHGDYTEANLLRGTGGASSFAQYGELGEWTVSQDGQGQTAMSQTVQTHAGEVYSLSFELAANHEAGTAAGTVEVLWNGSEIGRFDASGGSFEAQSLTFTGTGGSGEVTFRTSQPDTQAGPEVNTDGPIFYYEKEVEIGGSAVTVKAFAEGQANIYQVINGTLQVFDPASSSYQQAGSSATVTVNAIGFNTQDDLIYGLAVAEGSDSLGAAVFRGDLVMLDAAGDSYRIGETPYRSWTGDFDQNGNLWAFQSSMDFITMIDVDQVAADGRVATQTFKFPKSMISDQLWDVAYDAASQSFFGVTRPGTEGGISRLYQIGISDVEAGGTPVFTVAEITGTVIAGVLKTGAPAMTFGAAIHDANGNLYIAGNSGDHDMDDATPSAGGIYRVLRNPDGTVYLELMAESPRSYSNDGTADPRAMDPFAEVDSSSPVLVRDLTLTATGAASQSYDDTIRAGGGADTAHGGIGEDLVAGQGGNDVLTGGPGADSLFGGNASPAAPASGSYYDEFGNRYDAAGNLLPENNDLLLGHGGGDLLHGGAGHDTLDGGEGMDSLVGGSGMDSLRGGEGDDELAGGAGHDGLLGDGGNDALTGGSGDDTLEGGSGSDTLRGGEGSDRLTGGGDSDLLHGGIGDDILDGGTGSDTLQGSTGNDTLNDSYGDNLFEGGSGHDSLTGGTGADTLDGGSGDDVLAGAGGSDCLKGGTGNDRLDGGSGNDKLYGGSGDDEAAGGAGNDYFNLSSGNDTVHAGDGRDKILLGAGDDTASGGAGDDWFVFRREDLDGGTDTILDFTRDGAEADRLDFRSLGLLEAGVLREDWVNSHVFQNDGGSVTVELEGLTLHLLDHNGQQDAFYDWVCAGLQL
ncbi:calcium-binding protein (plasmid) [Roseobacteraceae bacterium NS-SX3]